MNHGWGVSWIQTYGTKVQVGQVYYRKTNREWETDEGIKAILSVVNNAQGRYVLLYWLDVGL